jgi:large subunit ribosomal protein L9
MEIILKQDVLNLGYAHDIITVKDGYARNYLIPEGFAVMATESAKKVNAENIRQKSFKAAKLKNEAEVIAKSIENIVVKIGAKATEAGKIYGSVNSIQIAAALKEQFNIEIDRKKIHVDGESIKELGSYQADVHLNKEVHGTVNFEVIAE